MQPRLVEDDVLHQGVAEALDGRALVLARDLCGVERLAGVAHDDVLVDGDVAGLLVHRELDRGAVELVERRAAAERMVGLEHPCGTRRCR